MSAVVVPFPNPMVGVLDDPGADAACSEHDPDLWFDEASFDRAIAVCRQCPVRVCCLNQALQAGETIWVWGGLTPADRAALPIAPVVPIRRRDRQSR